MVFDNMDMRPYIVEQYDELGKVIFNDEFWNTILSTSNGN